MNRSNSHHCVFFHVPRTGGSSIQSLGWWDEWTGHFPKADEADNLHGCFCFAFVRNPWDRFVSLYHYFAAMTPDHPWYRANVGLVRQARRSRDFGNFCRGLCDSPQHDGFFHFWPQTAWIADATGRLLVDYVGRFERLQHDFDRVCARLGLAARVLPRVNGSLHAPYGVYYDDKTRQLVASLARPDIETFGYRFEES